MPQLPVPSGKGPQVPEKPITDLVTPLANIGESLLWLPIPASSREFSPASNIDTAIRACKEERSDLIQSRQQMQMVKETLNDGYCDISGNIDDLSFLGKLDAPYQSLQPQITVSKVIWDKSKYIPPRVRSLAYIRRAIA